ncbi:ceramide kinase [Copidosoma floridanum]|uniref:ceramide kinase n=1 Tax=Copidosoma floridanum TaxID=29053 RepID=UPI0006C96E93|nr:ceramide kinase [Copidosoma floridanum]XP_014212642.1 ceramide kinase [Copidosoma floridanum]XP_014212644.1 ceramide kinase [Copidosoma floridanum]XP_014212645.1 ceramide kinase [Copidosoma floridanum]
MYKGFDPDDTTDCQPQQEDASYGTVLLSTFVIRKKRCRVYFHKSTLIWETERPPYKRWTLLLTDVIAVNFGNGFGKDEPGLISSSSPNPPTTFVLHYAARGAQHKWSHHSVAMSHDDPRQIASWVKTIRNCLASFKNRPKKILLFVNPYGGKKKGLEIWEKQVQPLMTIAGIESKVVITERQGHIREILLTNEIDSYQAAVSVGGDGTFAELFNGMIMRTARDQRIELNDINVKLPRPALPLGVIPSGSTDTLAYSLHGTTDVGTAVMHIIFGDMTGLDVSSVHNDQSLLRIYASILSYGYLGDVVRDSEKFRWMGPQRYDYSGLKKIIANKGYEAEVELLPESVNPAACTRCEKNCERCTQRSVHCSSSENNDDNDDESKYLKVKGKFFMINGANISCACSKSPMGFSPHCHIGDGCVDVILVRHTSLLNNVRMMLRLASKDKTLYDLPFVEVYRAKEFTFRAANPTDMHSSQPSGLGGSASSVWNCDGEVINASSVTIRVHRQLLRVFSRRMHPAAPKGTSCFCLM